MISPASDVHVQCANIQKEIESYLGIKEGSLVFEYQSFEGLVKLDLITVNPRHNQSFLFHSVKICKRWNDGNSEQEEQ